MPNEKLLNQISAFRPRILKIREQTSFGQTAKKIRNTKNIDYLLIERANIAQMTTALLFRLFNSKFIWIQGFTNPPAPNFLARLLLSQADHILVNSYYLAKKLQALGIDKSKITISRG